MLEGLPYVAILLLLLLLLLVLFLILLFIFLFLLCASRLSPVNRRLTAHYWTKDFMFVTFDHHDAGLVDVRPAQDIADRWEHPSMARRNARKSWSPMRSGSITVFNGSWQGFPLRGRSPLGQLLRPSQGLDSRPPEYLAGLFGVEVAAFAVMSNHVHVILRNRPDVVALWTDQEVARRWLTRLNPPQATRLQPVVRRVSPGGLQPVPLSHRSGIRNE